MVRQLQAMGNHLEPFFRVIADQMEGSDTASLAVTVLMQSLMILAFVLSLYAFAKVANMLIGSRELVVEQIVYVDDDDEDEDDAKEGHGNKKEEAPPKRRTTRGKKER